MNEDQFKPPATAAAAYVWWTIFRQAAGIILGVALFLALIYLSGEPQH